MKNDYTRRVDRNPRVGAQKLRNRMYSMALKQGNIELCHKMTNRDQFMVPFARSFEDRKGKVVRFQKQRPARVWRKFKERIGQVDRRPENRGVMYKQATQ